MTTNENLREHTEIKAILTRLKAGMIDYMGEEETDYSAVQVDQCMDILASYLEAMGKSNNKPEGMAIVEKTVLALNDLNEECEGALIETDQREDIAEVIIIAGHLMGYNTRDEDITEDWREW